jgi:hypothetical protein
VEKERIGDVFKKFMDKEYVQAKDELRAEIGIAKGEFLQRKLGLEKSPIPRPEAPAPDDNAGDEE